MFTLIEPCLEVPPIFILFSSSRGWRNKRKAGAPETLHLGGKAQRCQGLDLLTARDADGRLTGRRASLEDANLLGQLQYCKACLPIAQQLKLGLLSRNPKTGTPQGEEAAEATTACEAAFALPLLAARAEAEVAKEAAAAARAAQLELAARLEQTSAGGLLDARKECVVKAQALHAREIALAEREEQQGSKERKLEKLRRGSAILEDSSRRKVLDMEDEARRMECRMRSSEKTLNELLATFQQTRQALLEAKQEAGEEKRRIDELMILESNRLHQVEKQREGTTQSVADLQAQRLEIEGDIQKKGQRLADLEAHQHGKKRSLGGEVKALYQQKEGLEKQVAKLQDDVRRNLEVCQNQGVPTTPLPPEMLEPRSTGWRQPWKSNWSTWWGWK